MDQLPIGQEVGETSDIAFILLHDRGERSYFSNFAERLVLINAKALLKRTLR